MKTPDDAHIDMLRRLPPQRLRELLSTLSDEEAACLYYHWPLWARPSQRVPPGEDWKTWLILTGRGWGKGLSNLTPIATPSGWTTMGELSCGDRVFDEAGKPCHVTAVFDQPLQPVYRVTFSDGSYLDADGPHRWRTWTHAERKAFLRSIREADTSRPPENWPEWRSGGHATSHEDSLGPQIRTTLEIRDTLTYGKRGDLNHSIPVTLPLDLPPVDFSGYDPWAVGYWLGNGTRARHDICGHLHDLPHIAERIPLHNPQRQKDDLAFRAVCPTLQGIHKVCPNRLMPRKWLRGSITQRLALLQGLMDSDGFCDVGGTVEFCSTDKHLADDVFELAVTLGQKPVLLKGRSKLNGVDYGEKWRVKWTPTIKVFALPRKSSRLRLDGKSQAHRNHHRMIVSVEQVSGEPTRCITVDSPNSMFLAGRTLIPTSNTRTGAETVRHWVESGTASRIALIAPSAADARDVMVEGESGILAVSPPWFYPTFTASKRRLTWPNGAIATIYSAEDPDQLRGPQHDGGFCFTLNNQVLTSSGPLPINQVSTAHQVITPYGPKRVLNSSYTRHAATVAVRFDNGAHIEGTADHPIATPEGWVPLGHLKQGDKVLCSPRRLHTEAGYTISSMMDTTNGDFGSGSEKKVQRGEEKKLRSPHVISIATYISTKLGRFVKDTLFTISTATPKTITRAILNVFRKASIPGFICWEILLQIKRKLLKLSKDFTNPLQFILETVSSVESLSLTSECQVRQKCIVPSNVDGKKSELDTTVILHVQSSDILQPVYNLTVEGGVFFANGILVHNCDELCAWAYPETWDLYQFGLRLGRNPRTIVTTTPKPVKLLRDLVNDPTTKVTVGSSYENRDNLAPTFFHKIVSQYEGTRLGRQELHAEIINLEEEGIIQRSWFKLYSATKALPEFNYIIMSLDTAFSDDNLPDGRRKKETDPTACTVWGLFKPLNSPYCVMLLDAWAERLAYPDLRRRIPEEFRFSYGDPPHRPDVALIEAKGSGISLRQDLQRAGLPCRPYNPGHDDKVMRLHAVSHIVYHGRVYIPESKSRPGQFASWAEPFVSQVCTFPNDEHDDYVDCLSQILALVRDEGYIDFDTPPEEETDYYEPTPPTERRNPYATVK